MIKKLKLVLLLLTILLFFTVPSFAIDMDLNNTADNTSTTNSTVPSNSLNTASNTSSSLGNTPSTLGSSSSDATSLTSSSSSGSASVSSLSSLPEADLGLNNILNILLIAVGVILIFLENSLRDLPS